MRIRSRAIWAATATAALVAAVTFVAADQASAARPWAKARVVDARNVKLGDVTFTTPRGSSRTVVAVKFRGHSGDDVNRFHGFHIHANDNPTNGHGCIADVTQAPSTWFVSADGHWKNDPTELHGHHAGDLPSVFVNNDGTTELRFAVSKLSPSQVISRALVLHSAADNFGNVPVGPGPAQYTPGAEALAATQGTGNAGARIACGVIVAG